MGEVELVDAGSSETFANQRQPSEQKEFTDFMATNRSGRRNALAHLEMDGQCSMMAAHFGHEDLSVTGLAQKLQQMETCSFSEQPSTSGHCSFAGSDNQTTTR